jgi:uncharacterized protein
MLKWILIIVFQVAVAIGFVPAFAQDDVTLHRALNVDNDRALKRWLDAGGDPNQATPQGQTPLILAMKEGSFKVAAMLLEHPQTRVDATNSADETALMMAALKGHLDWVRRLVDKGAAINRDGWTPLHYAASDGAFEVVRWLLDKGARIDAPSPNRSTPLMMAARYGASESVEILLARGADPGLRNERGLSAADFARGAGRDNLAERLQTLAATPARR